MNVLDLFSGIGGFSLGLERAGFKTVGFCEVDDYCRRVLSQHWPGVPIHKDIRELDGHQYRGTVDVVCGGFPCQPYSVAGEQRGAADDRALWPEMLRVIREVQPSFVIGENVAGIINMELDTVLSDLEALGYACGAFVIPACAVDAWHRRDRVWILGHSHSHSQSVGAEHAEASELQGIVSDTERIATNTNTNTTSNGGRRRALRDEHGEHTETEQGRHDEQYGIAPDAGGARLQGLGLGLGTESEHAPFGDPCRWPVEPNVARVVHGLPLQLDRSRGLDDYAAEMAHTQGITKDSAVARFMREMWRDGEVGEASPQLRRSDVLRGSLQSLPQRLAQGRALGISDEELRGMWDEVSAEPLKEAQDLLVPMLERAWKAQRKKTVGQRVNRVKGLGNAVVPQIPEIIGRAIMETHHER